MHPSVNQVRKKLKKNWIETLRTVSQYGLNDQVRNDYRKDKTELVSVKFQSLSRTYSRTLGTKYNYVNKISWKVYLFKLNNNLANDTLNNMNFNSIYFGGIGIFYS